MGKRSKQVIASSKDFQHLDDKIMAGESSLSIIKIKTKDELAKEIAKKETRKSQQENIQKLGKALFLNLKDAADNNKIANNYLFELIKEKIKENKAYSGLYKVDVIKVNPENIICRIRGGENYKHDIMIKNEEIMEKKMKTHRKRIKNEKEERIEQPTQFEEELEKGDPEKEIHGFNIEKIYYNQDGERIVKTRPGRREDFLIEIEYGDSVIIDVQGDIIKKINPDDIIEEIGNYIKENDNGFIKTKKIQTAMKFFNESKEQLSSEYIQKFFNFVRNEESERNKKNKGKPGDRIENYKEHFTQVIKRYLNQRKHYVHKENDIDKSSLIFLLDKFGIKIKNKIQEINNDDTKNIDSGVFWDIDKTKNGMEIKEKTVGMNKKGKEIKKKKIIFSEHSDGSDKAILTNRPSSTTQMIFKIAKELGAIDKEQLPQIERFVNFVNTVDSMDYQISSIDYKHNYQTLFGLYRSIDIQDIFEYFKDPKHSGFEKLPEWYMKKTKIITRDGKKSDITLQEISEKQQKRIEQDITNFEKIKNSGKELLYGKIKFIVDIEEKPENRVQYGAQTSGYNGYGFFNIKPERGNIYIYSPKKLPVMIEGFPTDGHFLIINNPTRKDLEKLFESFCTENDQLKENIITRLGAIQAKKEEPVDEKGISSRCKLFLPKLTKQNLKIGKTYTAIINSDIQNRIAYCTLDSEEKIKGRIKVEDKNLLKKYKKGDTIKVKIDKIPKEEGELLTLLLVG